MTTLRVEKENRLNLIVRLVHQDNAVEFLVGALSSVITDDQLDALIAHLNEAHLNPPPSRVLRTTNTGTQFMGDPIN